MLSHIKNLKAQVAGAAVYIKGTALENGGFIQTVKIIKGNKAINVNELAKIASVLGTTTDELLTVGDEPVSVDSLSFMGSVTCGDTREKINLMRQAIDEIHMLEDLLNA